MSPYSLSPEDLDHVLTHTRDLWAELRGQRLFITGGTGFFGMWLVESFLWANERLSLGAEAVVLSRDPAAFLRKAPHLAQWPVLSLHPGDVRTFEFPAGHFSHVIHAATPVSRKLNAEAPLVMVDVIVAGTRRTLDFARHCGARKFLLTSSGAVYGRQPSELQLVPEDYRGAPDPMDPASAYGLGKRLAEHLCAMYASKSGLECKIARGFAFVGPYLPLDAHVAIGNFIRDGLSGNTLQVNGDGTPYRSYLYAADLSIWLWTILFRGTSCVPYNVGSNVAVSIADLAQLVAVAFRPVRQVQIHARPMPGRPAERYVPSTDRAQQELGLTPLIDLRQAVERTTAWYAPRLQRQFKAAPI